MSRHVAVSALSITTALVCGMWESERSVGTQSSSFTYSVRDLGTLGGSTSAAYAAQDAFLIAGSATTIAGATHAFSFRFVGGMNDLGTLGGTNSEAFANDLGGSVVGRAQVASGRYHATLWPDREPAVDLGTLGGPQSVAYSFNSAGTIVGVSDTATGGPKAFVVQGGTMTPLGVSFGGTTSAAYDVNEAGTIVGTAALANNAVSHAFAYTAGKATDLGSPGGTSVATSINEVGDVVGYWLAANGSTTRAFLYRSGSMQTLPALGGPLTKPRGINDDGVIVGESDTSSGARHAVIWRDGIISDLNTLIPAGSGWVLQAATAIDPAGHIVGYGLHNGVRRAFMLTPPIDLQLRITNVLETSTNFPNPHQTGQSIPFGANVTNNTPFWATNLVVTSTLTGSARFVSVLTDNADCTVSPQTLTCRFKQPIGPGDLDRGILYAVKADHPGTFTHTARVSGDQYDPNLANNSASEQSTAVSLATFDVRSPVVGGTSALSRATLTSPAPSGGATVKLSSSNTAVATVPSQFDVPEGGLSRETYVTTTPVNAPTDVTISATYGLVTITKTLTVIPHASAPFGGTARPVPGTVEAEDYDTGGERIGYHDTTAGNRGGEYRTDDVDIERTTDAGGGYDVGWAVAGEFLQYSLSNDTAGTFTLEARVASKGSGGTFHVEFNGVDVTGPMSVPDTGGWQSWRTLTRTVSLTGGVRPLRIVFDTNGVSGGVGNLNWIRLAPAGAIATPFGGTAKTLPGVVQVEQFDAGGESVAYHDTTNGNIGGVYRQTNVDIQATNDTGGGYNVAWTRAGEWMAYTVKVGTAGTYSLTVRVASTAAGGTFHIEFNGVDKTGPLTVPATGGWQTWTTVTKAVNLGAGTQSMRIVMDSNSATTGGVGNFNWISVGTP